MANADLLTGAVWRMMKQLKRPFLDDACSLNDASDDAAEPRSPNYRLCYNNTLLLKAEYRRSAEELEDARSDLVAKMCGGWNATALRGLPFLPCYVAAGTLVQFFALLPPAHPGAAPVTEPVTPPYDIADVVGRCWVERVALNMVRVFEALAERVSPGPTMPLYKPIKRSGDVIVTVMDKHVIKICYPAPAEVYRLLAPQEDGPATQPRIPHAIVVEDCKPHSRRMVQLRLSPVCQEVLPADEAELRTAVRCVTSALSVLHSHQYVHRDVRWPNILKDAEGSWRLVDFELARNRRSVTIPCRHMLWRRSTCPQSWRRMMQQGMRATSPRVTCTVSVGCFLTGPLQWVLR